MNPSTNQNHETSIELESSMFAFADLEPTPAHVEWVQKIRLQAFMLIEVGELLGKEFIDTDFQASVQSKAEEWLDREGVKLVPLPDDRAMEVLGEIVGDILLGGDDLADQFGDVDAVSSDSAGETLKP